MVMSLRWGKYNVKAFLIDICGHRNSFIGFMPPTFIFLIFSLITNKNGEREEILLFLSQREGGRGREKKIHDWGRFGLNIGREKPNFIFAPPSLSNFWVIWYWLLIQAFILPLSSSQSLVLGDSNSNMPPHALFGDAAAMNVTFYFNAYYL